MAHSYGWAPSAPDPRNFVTKPSAAFPSEYDPRNEGRPAIYDQLELGSCTANATARAFRWAYVAAGKPDPGDLSRLHIYGAERWLEGGEAQFKQDSGAYGHDAFKIARKHGAVNETIWPYQPADFANEQAYTAANDDLEKRYRIGMYSHPHPDLHTFSSVLASRKPIALGFNVYESFESDEVARTGVVPLPSRGERVLGGHEVLIEGYVMNAGKVYFLVANSWGTGWGLDGYFLMPPEYVFGYGSSDWRCVDSVPTH